MKDSTLRALNEQSERGDADAQYDLGRMYCDSHYVFGLHSNYDPQTDAFAIQRESARNGNLLRPKASHRFSRYWLPGDELNLLRPVRELLHVAGIYFFKALVPPHQGLFYAPSPRA